MGYVPELDSPADLAPAQIDGAMSADQIVDGDLIFTSRPGMLQDLCNRAGEPWRHVGIATTNDGIKSITEVSRTKFDVRPIERVLEVNHEVAVARIAPEHRPLAAKAAGWCGRHFGSDQVYAWHDVMMAGLITTARHYTLQSERDALHKAIEAAAAVMGSRRPKQGRVSFTCSAFIAEAFAAVGCPLEFDLRVPRAADNRPGLIELIRGGTRTQLRSNRPSTREYGIVLYALLAGMIAASKYAELDDDGTSQLDQFRWAMPGDLWRSPSVVERYIVLGNGDLASTSEMVDTSPLHEPSLVGALR